MKSHAEDEFHSDEIKREDGLERYWFFYNGEWAETVFGLVSTASGVFWCFLYVLGYSDTIVGYILGALAVLAFLGWYLVWKTIRRYEESGWRRGKGKSVRGEKIRIYIAVSIWLFILLCFGSIILLQRKNIR